MAHTATRIGPLSLTEFFVHLYIELRDSPNYFFDLNAIFQVVKLFFHLLPSKADVGEDTPITLPSSANFSLCTTVFTA